jgi:hypothetical protein
VIFKGKEVYHAIYTQYSEVFLSSKVNVEVLTKFLASVNLPLISEEDQRLLEANFTAEEILTALKSMNHSATAGETGLNVKWVLHFKHLFINDFVQVCNYIWDNYKSDSKFWSSIGILISKNTGAPSIDNSRLIHLFNWEYKVITKCIQRRLLSCIKEIIHPNQCGLPQSPPISFLLAQIREFIHHANLLQEKQAAILLLDISRAFDDLEHEYLFGVLQKVGIPARLLQLLKYIFGQRTTRIQIDKFLTSPIKIEKGVPQGDALSPTLYTLAMAPILYYIEQRMTGSIFKGGSLKFYSYMDDQFFFPANAPEIDSILEVYDQIQILAGLKLNKKKSKILTIGNNQCVYTDQVPVVTHAKILGITWYNSIEQTAQSNINMVVNRIIHDCVVYKNLFQSLLSRVRFLKVFIYSKATYILQLFLLDRKSLARILQFTGNFIWHGQILRTPREILYLSEDLGGLSLLHIGIHNRALVIHRTLAIICDQDTSFSQVFLMQILKLIDIEGPINIKPWGPCIPYLQPAILTIAYEHMAKSNIDTANVGTIYTLLLQRFLNHNATIRKVLQDNSYRSSWQLLGILKHIPPVQDVMYKIYHSVYMTKARLYEKNIIKSNACTKCGMKEDMAHVLFHCYETHDIWTCFGQIIRRVTRSSFSLDMVTKMLSLPLQRYFPPNKTKFVLWLLAQTTYWILQEKVEWNREMYRDMLLITYKQFCTISHMRFDNYHHAIY